MVVVTWTLELSWLVQCKRSEARREWRLRGPSLPGSVLHLRLDCNALGSPLSLGNSFPKELPRSAPPGGHTGSFGMDRRAFSPPLEIWGHLRSHPMEGRGWPPLETRAGLRFFLLPHPHPQVTGGRLRNAQTAEQASPYLPSSYIKDAEASGLLCHKHEDKFLIPSKKMLGDGGAGEK